MRRWLMAALFASMTIGQVSAQNHKIRDVFRQMPDSLMPYLSQNNRLDFIDFLDSNMKAEVKNMLGGTSEMTSLADNSLTIRMNESMRVDLLLLPLAEPIDSMSEVVALIETFLVDSIYGDSYVNYYSPEWKPLPYEPVLADIDKKRIDNHRLQNIIKKDDEVLNKR